MIVVRQLRKVYGELVALADLSFQVARGEFVALLGPNGAGKTTALHLLLGLIRPSAGEVRVLGLDPQRQPNQIYARINFCASDVQLPHNLSVRRNLTIFGRLYGLRDPRRKIDELLALLEVQALAETLCGRLSAGERMRVNLCKCLINDPELLLLDEPTANLDPDMADRVRSLLLKLNRERGTTILYTSHNMAEVERLCDRIVFIHRGRKVAEGPADEIIAAYGKRDLEEVFIHLAREGAKK